MYPGKCSKACMYAGTCAATFSIPLGQSSSYRSTNCKCKGLTPSRELVEPGDKRRGGIYERTPMGSLWVVDLHASDETANFHAFEACGG